MASEPARDTMDLDARDRVLERFFDACPLPMPEDVEFWVGNHPEYEAELRDCAEAVAHAALARISPTPPAIDPRDEAAITEAVRRAMGDRYPGRSDTLADLVRAVGRPIADLADKVDIYTDLLADVASGRVAPPNGGDLFEALASELRATTAELRQAAEATRTRPAVGAAKSSSAHRLSQIPFAEAVRASPMSDELKARWLRGE